MSFLAHEGATYSNLKIHHLLSERTHLIVKAKAILSGRLSREYGVQLPLFRVLHNDLPIGAGNGVVDIEGAARLDLREGCTFS